MNWHRTLLYPRTFGAMRPRSIAIAIGAVFAVAVSLLCLRLLLGRAPTVSVASSMAEKNTMAAQSLFLLNSPWTTDEHRVVRLEQELRGHIHILALIFTHCPGACPTLVREMLQLDKSLSKDARARSKFLLISIDPERDTPQVLAEYRETMRLDRARWTLLRGAAADVRELSAVLGFSYGKSSENELVHAKLLTVLNSEGEIVHQQAGVGDDSVRLVQVVEELAATEARF
jgi:protein SCO1